MTFFDTNNINEMFKEFKIIKYEEIEKDKKTALGQDKHWHIFDLIYLDTSGKWCCTETLDGAIKLIKYNDRIKIN